MAALAAFARSEKGLLYSAVCERYGVDPAAAISDDVIAMNFRIALATMAKREEADEEPEALPGARVVTDLEEQIRRLRESG